MQSKLPLILAFLFASAAICAQHARVSALDIGDAAPRLKTSAWIKGDTVFHFRKNQTYVLEYWATWCKPCKAAMPHLSVLAKQFRGKVTVIGVNAFEDANRSRENVYAFVKNMGAKMDYSVATQDSAMWAAWMNASAEQGIPKTFVVDDQTRLAWIGHPKDLDDVLGQIVDHTWDINKARNKRRADRYLAALDDSLNYEMMQYQGNFYKHEYRGKPESGLLAIDKMVKAEPALKYAPYIAFNTFSFLLKTDMKKAYDYGKVAITTATYTDPAYEDIISVINLYSDKLKLPADIYLLGARAYQIQIDEIPYPEIVPVQDYYSRMAFWYWRGNDTANAVKAQQKAIGILRSKGTYSGIKMRVFETRLAQYRGERKQV